MSSLPLETKFHKTKAKPIMAILLFGVPLLISGYSILHYFLYGSGNGIVFLLVMVCLFGVSAYLVLKKAQVIIANEALIVLTQTGMQVAGKPFVSWNGMLSIQVETVGSGNHLLSYLNYEHKGGKEKLLINELLVTPEELYKAILRYRADSDFNPAGPTKKVDEKEEMVKRFFDN